MRGIHLTYPSLLLLGLLVIIPPADAQQGQTNDVTYSRQPGFRIPFTVDPGDRRIHRVELYVSEDRGKTWNAYGSVSPLERKAFEFQTNRDGTYWFTVRTVDRDGRGYPATLDQAIAQQKVVIDTQPPTVNLHSLPSGNGQVGVEWQVSDDNLDLNSLILPGAILIIALSLYFMKKGEHE